MTASPESCLEHLARTHIITGATHRLPFISGGVGPWAEQILTNAVMELFMF